MKTKIYMICLIFVMSLFLVVSACSKKEEGAGTEIPDAASSADLMDTADPASPVAMVNGKVIQKSELDRAVLGIVLQNGMDPSKVPFFLQQFGSQILDQLIQREILYEEALREGYAVPSEEFESALAGFSGNFNSPEEFSAALQERGLTEETFREDFRKQMTISNYIEKTVVPKAVVPDEAVREAYDENPSNFEVPEEVKASHILIQVAESDPQEKKDEALERAKEITVLARQEGADFAQLARERSEGPTAPAGGDLGFFSRGRMVKPFEDAAFSMEVGKVSDPVLTQFGYHVIKVTDRKEGRTLPFEEVREKLGAELKNRMVGEMVGRKIEEIKAKSDIQILFKPEAPAGQESPEP